MTVLLRGRSLLGFAFSALLLTLPLATHASAQDADPSITAAPSANAQRPIQLNQFTNTKPRRASSQARKAKSKPAQTAKAQAKTETPETKSPATEAHLEPPGSSMSVFDHTLVKTVKPVAIAPNVANANAQMMNPSSIANEQPPATVSVQQQADDIFRRVSGTEAAGLINEHRENKASAEPPLMEVVASDQVNEVDLAADAPKADATLASATMETHPQAALASDSDTLFASTIGRVFIAIGALLTIASAARLYFA